MLGHMGIVKRQFIWNISRHGPKFYMSKILLISFFFFFFFVLEHNLNSSSCIDEIKDNKRLFSM
jgi:hypothetical protein